MRPGREVDSRIAREVFGHEVWSTNRMLHEKTPLGTRPLRHFTKEIEWAWQVADKMRISLIATQDGQWFAFTANNQGWSSPEEFASFLQVGQFAGCGAAVGSSAPLAICEAAINALDKRRSENTAIEPPEASIVQ
jgi:hypothetical protein